MPAPHEYFAAHLGDRSEMGVNPSPLRVAAVVITHNHRHARFDVPLHRDVAPVPSRALFWN